MNPRIGLLTPVKVAFGKWLGEFYADFVPDTAATAEWAARGQLTAMAWAPARMVDQVEDMLASWRTNRNDGKPSTSNFVPVVLVAMAQDYTESPPENGRPALDLIPFSFPTDSQGRSFRMRAANADIRTQVVIVASEVASATSIAVQLALWAMRASTLKARYSFAGQNADASVKIIAADRLGIPTPAGEQVCILAVDFTLRTTLPIIHGQPGNPDGTDGWPVMTVIDVEEKPDIGPPPGVTAEDWAAFGVMTGNSPAEPAHADRDAPGVLLHGVVQGKG